jgi:hypothetical protein
MSAHTLFVVATVVKAAAMLGLCVLAVRAWLRRH